MKTILVADSDSLILRLVYNTLASPEYQIVDASLVDEALRAMEEHDIDLALVDHAMIEDEPKLLTHLQAHRPDAKILLMVAPDEESREVDVVRAHGRLDKPFSPMALIRQVFALLGGGVDPEIAARPLHDLERQQLLLYARDLAKMRREDERKTKQLKAAHARLQEFEKMKDMFLALVSHELRTPLTVLKGNIHLLKRFLKGAEPGTKEERMVGFVGGLNTACERLENLVTDLMSYSSVRCGVEPFELRKIDMRVLLSSVIRDFESLAQAKLVTLEFKPEDQEMILMGDAGRLREAFSHLIKNAIYFNVPQGRVIVRCEAPDNMLAMSVTDTGPGVPPEERDRVFTPFYQAQDPLTRRVEGVGLGLAITRHIVESHGGQIWLAGELGQGTQVCVSIPASPPEYSEGEFAPKPPTEFEALLTQSVELQEGEVLEYARELYSAYDRERIRRRHVEDRNREMERTFLETLGALMRQINVRDMHQESHNDTVISIATEIARKIDPLLPKKKDFQLSLLLHDIGKIGVAESLLQKVGKLTREEHLLLRSHVNVGTELLESIEFLRPALATVRHHHERWDGKGYPDGLVGKEIPLGARIIAVADSFGAMVANRPYRRALPHIEARSQITKMSGTQYDPEVVEAFLQVYDRYGGVWPEAVLAPAGSNSIEE